MSKINKSAVVSPVSAVVSADVKAVIDATMAGPTRAELELRQRQEIAESAHDVAFAATMLDAAEIGEKRGKASARKVLLARIAKLSASELVSRAQALTANVSTTH